MENEESQSTKDLLKDMCDIARVLPAVNGSTIYEELNLLKDNPERVQIILRKYFAKYIPNDYNSLSEDVKTIKRVLPLHPIVKIFNEVLAVENKKNRIQLAIKNILDNETKSVKRTSTPDFDQSSSEKKFKPNFDSVGVSPETSNNLLVNELPSGTNLCISSVLSRNELPSESVNDLPSETKFWISDAQSASDLKSETDLRISNVQSENLALEINLCSPDILSADNLPSETKLNVQSANDLPFETNIFISNVQSLDNLPSETKFCISNVQSANDSPPETNFSISNLQSENELSPETNICSSDDQSVNELASETKFCISNVQSANDMLPETYFSISNPQSENELSSETNICSSDGQSENELASKTKFCISNVQSENNLASETNFSNSNVQSSNDMPPETNFSISNVQSENKLAPESNICSLDDQYKNALSSETDIYTSNFELEKDLPSATKLGISNVQSANNLQSETNFCDSNVHSENKLASETNICNSYGQYDHELSQETDYIVDFVFKDNLPSETNLGISNIQSADNLQPETIFCDSNVHSEFKLASETNICISNVQSVSEMATSDAASLVTHKNSKQIGEFISNQAGPSKTDSLTILSVLSNLFPQYSSEVFLTACSDLMIDSRGPAEDYLINLVVDCIFNSEKKVEIPKQDDKNCEVQVQNSLSSTEDYEVDQLLVDKSSVITLDEMIPVDSQITENYSTSQEKSENLIEVENKLQDPGIENTVQAGSINSKVMDPSFAEINKLLEEEITNLMTCFDAAQNNKADVQKNTVENKYIRESIRRDQFFDLTRAVESKKDKHIEFRQSLLPKPFTGIINNKILPSTSSYKPPVNLQTTNLRLPGNVRNTKIPVRVRTDLYDNYFNGPDLGFKFDKEKKEDEVIFVKQSSQNDGKILTIDGEMKKSLPIKTKIENNNGMMNSKRVKTEMDCASAASAEPPTTTGENHPYYFKMMEIFPDICPKYLKRFCSKIRPDCPVDDVITDLLSANYDKRNVTVSVEDNTLKFDEQQQILIDLFPDADPTYLQHHCERLIDQPENFRLFVASLLETRDYPTKNEYLKKQKLSSQEKQYTTEFDVKNFLDIIPNPEEYFNDPKRQTTPKSLYDIEYAVKFLKNTFNTISVKDVTAIFKKTNYSVIESAKQLVHVKSMKVRRKPYPVTSCKNIPLLQEIAYVKNKDLILAYIKDQELQKIKAKEAAKANGTLMTCQCCYDEEVMPNDTATCELGKHTFCKDCIKKGCEVLIGDGKLEFPCLETCDSYFTLQVLKAVLNPNVFSKMAQRRQLEEIKSAGVEDLEFCPFCDFATIPAPGDKIFRCLNDDCMKESCRLCKEPSHIPLRCEEVEKDEDVKKRTYIENKMTEALLRKCYSCGIKFIKETGCNKMTCSCGAMMCYVCNQPVKDYKHFNGQGGDQFHLCPLYNDMHKMHVNDIKQSAEAAKKELGLDKDAKLKVDPTVDLDQHYRRLSKTNPQLQQRVFVAPRPLPE